MHQLWAMVERLVARGSSAVTSVVIAAITSPVQFGYYSWMIVALTFFQGLAEQPARQIAPAMLGDSQREALLRRYALTSAGAGVVGLCLTALGVSLVAGGVDAAELFLELLPLAFVPIALMSSIRQMASLQVSGKWRVISNARVGAAAGSVIFGVGVALLTRSIVGASIAVLVAETGFCLLLLRGHKGTSSIAHTERASVERPRHAILHFSLYSSLGWLQAQLDRVLLGGLAGTAALGSYTFGASVGRTPGDAVASSYANILRVQLRDLEDDESIRRRLNSSNRTALLLATFAFVGVFVLSKAILPLFMNAEWTPALGMAPILGLCAFPSLLSWSAGPVHLQRARTSRASWAPIVGIACAPLIAWSAMSFSLSTAAWFVVLRECLLATTQLALMGKAAPWSVAVKCGTLLAACSLLVLSWP